MSRVSDLCRRVESLERKKTQGVLLKALTTYDADVAKLLDGLSSSSRGTAIVESVFGPDAVTQLRGKLRDSAQKMARGASSLAKKIRANAAYVAKNEAGDAIADLKSHASTAARVVGDTWTKAIADRCGLLRARTTVAELAGAGAVSKIRREIEVLESRHLPSSTSEAKEIREAFVRAEATVAKVGASVRLSSFIEKAIKGSASARDLDDPEVREFLDAHHLWQRLTVKLT